MNKQIFMMLGMPRSGTSAITRSLKALGIDLGSKLLPADDRNEKGFYEDGEVLYQINRGVSAVMKYRWMDLSMDDKQIDQIPLLRDYKHYAMGIVCEHLASFASWGFKDPRTLTIFPFWQSVIKAVNAQERYVLVVRHPLAAANSVAKFANTDVKSGLLLWVKFIYHALAATENKMRVVVSYEMMMKNPRLQLERMRNRLDISFIPDEAAVREYADEFLDDKLRHYEFSDQEWISHPDVKVAPLCVKLYDLMTKLAADEIRFDTAAYQSAWDTVKLEWEKTVFLHEYIDSLQKENKELERKIRGIRKSIVWKIFYPLTMAENKLRDWRRRSRERRRLAILYE